MISRNRRSDLRIAQRAGVALARRAQHLRLALRAVEVHRAPAGGLGDADLLRQPRPLVEQRVHLLIDRIDARAHGLQVGLQGLRAHDRRGLPARGLALAFAFCRPWNAAPRRQTMRAESTPSIAPILPSTSGATGRRCRSGCRHTRRATCSGGRRCSGRRSRGRWRSGPPCSARCGWRSPGAWYWAPRGSTASGKLTLLRMLPFSRKSRSVSATMTAQFSSASPVEAPRCGSVTTCGWSLSALLGKSHT